MGVGKSRRQVKDDEVVSQVNDVLRFANLQGTRSLIEHLEDDGEGRQRLRVRVVREGGQRDFVFDVLVEKDGLMGIYPA